MFEFIISSVQIFLKGVFGGFVLLIIGCLINAGYELFNDNFLRRD